MLWREIIFLKSTYIVGIETTWRARSITFLHWYVIIRPFFLYNFTSINALLICWKFLAYSIIIDNSWQSPIIAIFEYMLFLFFTVFLIRNIEKLVNLIDFRLICGLSKRFIQFFIMPELIHTKKVRLRGIFFRHCIF